VNFSLTNLSASGPIALVQHTSKDAGTTTSSTLAFPSSNTAGHFIAVVIRAGKTGQLFTVTDSQKNTYRKAMQFNETIDSTTLGIFYAENIAGGANTITVSDTISGTMRFAILEYSGVAIANSLDGAAAASQGTGASLNSERRSGARRDVGGQWRKLHDGKWLSSSRLRSRRTEHETARRRSDSVCCRKYFGQCVPWSIGQLGRRSRRI
jgi:hypothetical protein